MFRCVQDLWDIWSVVENFSLRIWWSIPPYCGDGWIKDSLSALLNILQISIQSRFVKIKEVYLFHAPAQLRI